MLEGRGETWQPYGDLQLRLLQLVCRQLKLVKPNERTSALLKLIIKYLRASPHSGFYFRQKTRSVALSIFSFFLVFFFHFFPFVCGMHTQEKKNLSGFVCPNVEPQKSLTPQSKAPKKTQKKRKKT